MMGSINAGMNGIGLGGMNGMAGMAGMAGIVEWERRMPIDRRWMTDGFDEDGRRRFRWR